MADQGGYDPIQANYGESMDPGQNATVAGLVFLASFAAISIVSFLSVGAAAGAGITVNGVTYYGVTHAQAVILNTLATGEMTGAGQATLEALVTSWEAHGTLSSIGGILALNAYNHTFDNYDDYDAFIDYLESAGATCWGTPELQTYCIF